MPDLKAEEVFTALTKHPALADEVLRLLQAWKRTIGPWQKSSGSIYSRKWDTGQTAILVQPDGERWEVSIYWPSGERILRERFHESLYEAMAWCEWRLGQYLDGAKVKRVLEWPLPQKLKVGDIVEWGDRITTVVAVAKGIEETHTIHDVDLGEVKAKIWYVTRPSPRIVGPWKPVRDSKGWFRQWDDGRTAAQIDSRGAGQWRATVYSYDMECLGREDGTDLDALKQWACMTLDTCLDCQFKGTY